MLGYIIKRLIKRYSIVKDVNNSRLDQAVAVGIALGIILGIFIDVYMTPVAEEAHAEITEVIPVEVQIEVTYTKEDIIKKIEDAFPESPVVAVKIAKCESGLVPDIQSQHTLSYGQERSFGLFQIHEPAWDHVAKKLGLDDYQTDVEDNIAMARYIYEQSGKRWSAWSCFTKNMI